MNLLERLAELSAKATSGEWGIGLDDYGQPFPEIMTGPFTLASFTMGEDADENQACAELAATLVNAFRAGELGDATRIAALEERVRVLETCRKYLAGQRTIHEIMTGPSSLAETTEERIAEMGRRKEAHDNAILAARALGEQP